MKDKEGILFPWQEQFSEQRMVGHLSRTRKAFFFPWQEQFSEQRMVGYSSRTMKAFYSHGRSSSLSKGW